MGMVSLGRTRAIPEGPMSAFSDSSVERLEHRILSDLGVLAVDIFLLDNTTVS